jgi:hypothetical protein
MGGFAMFSKIGNKAGDAITAVNDADAKAMGHDDEPKKEKKKGGGLKGLLSKVPLNK